MNIFDQRYATTRTATTEELVKRVATRDQAFEDFGGWLPVTNQDLIRGNAAERELARRAA